MSTRRLRPLRSRTIRVELPGARAAQLNIVVSIGAYYALRLLRGGRMKIGIAGTGRMGSAIAARLLAAGHEVAVWNRSAAEARALEAAGARVASDLADLAGRSEAVIT